MIVDKILISMFFIKLFYRKLSGQGDVDTKWSIVACGY